MKIGILTHHWLYNFGANLQAFSTSETLKEMGHEVIFLNYRPQELVERYQAITDSCQAAEHQNFCDSFLTETPLCPSDSEIIEIARALHLDVAISGSDAVLRLNRNSIRSDLCFPNPYWLTWTKYTDIKRQGFLAASNMGSNYLNLTTDTKIGISEAISKLHYISVRDRWTDWMLSNVNYRKKNQVNFCPDPVANLNRFYSETKVKNGPSNEEKGAYVLLSLYETSIESQWMKSFVEHVHTLGYKVYTLPLPEYEVSLNVDKVLKLPMSPFSWYAWIKHSAAYVGVRFHPIMCALVNQVPFVAVDYYGLKLNRRRYRLLSRPFSPILNYSSKTYDLCMRANKQKFYIKGNVLSKRPASLIVQLLQEQLVLQEREDLADNLKGEYKNSISQILMDSP